MSQRHWHGGHCQCNACVLAAQTVERLAVLDRVRPILSEAIHNAKGEEAVMAVTFLGIRIMSAILKEE